MNAKHGFGLVAAITAGVLATSVALKSQPVAAIQQWEYAVVTGYKDGDVDFSKNNHLERRKAPREVTKGSNRPAAAANWGANQLGTEGWEAVSITSDSDIGGCHILFRRAK
jgi:hypothetical protein